jgi:hypothetical protein
MANSYLLAGEAFTSKAAVQCRVRSLLQVLGPVSPQHLPFVLALLERHPSAQTKIGVGVASIEVRAIMPYGTHGFWIHRVDGSGTDFSYLQCLSPSTRLAKFKAACRTAILPQVAAAKFLAFEWANEITCPISGEVITRDTAHVDHAPPWTFQHITDEFIRKNALDVTTIELAGGGDGETSQRFAQPIDAFVFAEFHRSLAVLRVVSKTANLLTLRKNSGK